MALAPPGNGQVSAMSQPRPCGQLDGCNGYAMLAPATMAVSRAARCSVLLGSISAAMISLVAGCRAVPP